MVRIRLLVLFFGVLATANPSLADDAVNVRASAKDDYTRIVFEWPKPPSYVTDKTSSELTLKFQSAASFKLEGQAPTGLPRVTSYKTPDSKTAVIGFTAGQDVRHFEIGNRIIVDIRGPAKAAAPAPAAQKEDTKKEATPITRTEAPKAVATPAIKVDKVAAVPEEKVATGAPLQIQMTSTEMMGISVFKRFGNLWIVTDAADYALSPQISGEGAKKFGTFERIPLKEATAFRLALPEDRPFHVEGGGLVWKIIADGKAAADKPTEFTRKEDAAQKSINLLWPVPTARRVIEINDPIVGDVLKVVTVDSSKLFSGDVHEFAEFGSLPSFAGMAIASKIDDLDVKKTPEGVLITAVNGISVSPESDTAFLQAPTLPTKPAVVPDPAAAGAVPQVEEKTELVPGARIFKFGDWKMGDANAVEQNRRILMSGLSAKDNQAKAQDLLKLAKMELAHSRGPEAGGYLDLAEQFLPDLKETPEFTALKSASNAMSGNNEEGLRGFSSESLKVFPEVALWKAYTLAGLEDWKQASDVLPADFETLAGYPDDVRIPMALTLTEVALRDGDLNKAEQLIKMAEGNRLILPHKAALDYMKGEALRQQGKIDEAEKLWGKLKDGADDLYRAKAGLALTTLQLERKQLKPAEGIDRLEGMRYAWRGDELEASINYRLGQLYIANKDPLKGLALLRQAASLSPASEQSKKITDEMTATFAKLFEPNRIKDINPVDAISLYNEFSSLSPPGPARDRIVRQLADRLVEADLLPRAANLLQAQVDSGKLIGADGAITAVRLASIYVQDSKPDKAQMALDKATGFLGATTDQPGLKRQISILRAEALSEQKKPEEAFAVLAGLEQNEEVLRLRADIGWSNQRWQDAADSLEALVQVSQISPTRPAGDEESNLLLNWAVALYLADNRYVLANLREKYSTAMAASPKASQFEVVTRPRQSALLADRDTIDAIIEETEIFKGFVDSSRASNAATSAENAKAPAKAIAPVAPAQSPVTVPQGTEVTGETGTN